MAKLNKKPEQIKTHEGAVAKHITPEFELRRAVMSCMLWENSFYESGESIAIRIERLVAQVNSDTVAQIAKEARSDMKLRHVPLLIARGLARKGYEKLADLLEEIIQRPDEITEFLAIYWKEGKQPLANQVKKGIARAFHKFDEYQLAKWDRGEKIKLRDALFLSHPKPKDKDQEALWKRLVDGELKTPDTWEVSLSSGGNKQEHWTRLLKEKKLGALALLRNLRNMLESNVDRTLIKEAIASMSANKVLPYRFITAAKYAPDLEPELEKAMFRALNGMKALTGRTILLVDVSGSMGWNLSSKSEMSRMDAANGLSILLRELTEDISVYTFSEEVVKVPPRRGFALRDTIRLSQPHGITYLGKAIRTIDYKEDYDRLIIFTDEQSHDSYPDPKGKTYLINVSSEQNGVGYGKTHHIDGFSEKVFDYILEFEEMIKSELS